MIIKKCRDTSFRSMQKHVGSLRQALTEDTDVFSVEDVCDVGDGKPLFAAFNFEATKTQLRLHLGLRFRGLGDAEPARGAEYAATLLQARLR